MVPVAAFRVMFKSEDEPRSLMHRLAALVVASLVFSGCAGRGGDAGPPDSDGSEPWFSFSHPVTITPAPDGHGSEPSILAARDGAIYVVSVLGSAEARGDALWKSTDDGATWSYLNKPDYPFGGGDADLDEDEAGTLYLPGQWRPAAIPGAYVTGGESMAVSKDGGATWSTNPVASNLPVTDRQWSTTYGAGTAWLAFNQAQRGLVVTKSTDSGATWANLRALPGTWEPGDGVVSGGPNGIPGDILAGPDGTLYIPYGPGIGGGSNLHRLIISHDGGATFEVNVIHVVNDEAQPGAIFGTLAMDTEGGLYYVWAQSIEDGTAGVRVFLAFSHDGGRKWSPPLAVSHGGTTSVFPWIVVGKPGHIAIAYYSSPGRFLADAAPAGQEWYPTMALSRNAVDVNLTFDHAVLSEGPIHVGPLCTGGTSCDSQYRRLGDFFEIGLTPPGKVVAVWVDDTKEPRINAFARMVDGSLLG